MPVSTARHPLSVHAFAPGDEAGVENRRAGGALIDPIDRILMTSDGTVTTMLEACTGEPIVTSLTRQSGPASLDVLQREVGCWWQPSASLLELTPAERLIARRVVLQGRRSGVSLVAAESLIAADRLPDPHALDIGHVGASLGRLLNASGLATRRHIVEIAEVHDAAVNDRLDVARNVRLARRTYTIASTERIVAAVTEWFVPGRVAAYIAAPVPAQGPRRVPPTHVARTAACSWSTSDRRITPSADTNPTARQHRTIAGSMGRREATPGQLP